MKIVCSEGKTSIIVTFNGIVKKPVSPVKIVYAGNSISVPGKWDTGASMSCISLSTIKNLCLPPVGRAPVNTANGGRTANLYIFGLDIGNGIHFEELVACDGDIDGQNVGILIGMDVISNGDFLLQNSSGDTELYFKINNP